MPLARKTGLETEVFTGEARVNVFLLQEIERQRQVSISGHTIWDRDKSMGEEGIVFWFFAR